MDISDDRPEAEELDPEHAQVRDDPNQELGHQHDEDRDPLDIAIVLEHERVDKSEAIGAEEEDGLDPSPIAEADGAERSQ